jgi:hypothetical protein
VHVWEIPSLTGLDLQPGNIVFAVSAADIDDALSQTGTTVCDVKWRNGVKRDRSAPRHLYVPEPIIDRSLINGQPGHKVMVAITDLGGGAWSPRRLSRKDWLIILKLYGVTRHLHDSLGSLEHCVLRNLSLGDLTFQMLEQKFGIWLV